MSLPIGKCSGDGLVHLLKDKGQLTGLEIGCAEGHTTLYLLQSLPDIKLYGVDPYMDYIDWNTNHLDNRENVYQQFKSNVMDKYPGRFELYRLTSDDAVSKFEDESLDFIFIDGIHTYDQVLTDCRHFYPKVKKNGLFAGHDYTWVTDVGKAVNVFKEEVGAKDVSLTTYDVWYWYKH